MSTPRIAYTFSILSLVICYACLSPAQTTSSAGTAQELFDFHSGFWINLHHFIYWQAVVSQPQKGPPLALTKIDVEELGRLSPQERASWDLAVAFYTNSLVKRDLLFDDGMRAIKNELENAEASPGLANVEIPVELKDVLLKAAPIYKAHWWTAHDKQNRQWIAQLRPLLQEYGSGISDALIRIYDEPWPQYPVRVDAVAYANWAGAYTTLEPTRPTISTSDPTNQGAAALETVFHETSHGMIKKTITAIHAAEADVNAHKANGAFHSGSLWHAVLFYTTGELVSQRIRGYVPYADKNGLWERAWPDPDRSLIEKNWRPHMSGAVPLSKALAKLIADLAAGSSPPGV